MAHYARRPPVAVRRAQALAAAVACAGRYREGAASETQLGMAVSQVMRGRPGFLSESDALDLLERETGLPRRVLTDAWETYSG